MINRQIMLDPRMIVSSITIPSASSAVTTIVASGTQRTRQCTRITIYHTTSKRRFNMPDAAYLTEHFQDVSKPSLRCVQTLLSV